jgi:AraC family transcriptional regulator of arabinose operon
MIDSLDYLLKNSDLNVLEFDIQTRKEMKTYNRTRPHYIMSYHKKGDAKLRIGEKIYTITPGTVVLIPPNVEHDHYKDSDEETVFFWSHFTFAIGNVIDVLGIFHFPITFKLKDSIGFEKVFLEFVQATHNPNFLSSSILKKAKALEILYLTLDGIINYQDNSIQNIHKEGFLCILAEIIQKTDREITLKELSDKYHLHPTYISNRFKELFGKSPLQIHKELRVNKGKTLLKTSDMSITDIAYSIGFSGIPSFTRLFKSYVGISPTQYRNISKKKGE